MSGVGAIPGLANGNPVVFFDVTIGGHDAGRIKIEVRTTHDACCSCRAWLTHRRLTRVRAACPSAGRIPAGTLRMEEEEEDEDEEEEAQVSCRFPAPLPPSPPRRV